MIDGCLTADACLAIIHSPTALYPSHTPHTLYPHALYISSSSLAAISMEIAQALRHAAMSPPHILLRALEKYWYEPLRQPLRHTLHEAFRHTAAVAYCRRACEWVMTHECCHILLLSHTGSVQRCSVSSQLGFPLTKAQY